ncbi:hypothetical protein [Prevotella sp. oral taxon 299]|jgi:hypothetical protein|uniref:hypothetical protein n=1 Tax=Prevotella sp. oral taxon 299 TaxID=652716 RepID=UPI0001C3F9E8|nr:hypothetical protein [Prevotella sp. oral taxon 299]EFC70223.1 hypothetical protein HMPREF0669_01750 [Prevotella sp. oral taxon 299 str. F0039]
MKRKNSNYIQPLSEVYQLLNEMDLLAASDGKNKPKNPTLSIDDSDVIRDSGKIF